VGLEEISARERQRETGRQRDGLLISILSCSVPLSFPSPFSFTGGDVSEKKEIA
jgi:hypothetical protein